MPGLRSFLQFRFRTLLLVVTLAAFGGVAYRGLVLPYQRQHEAGLALAGKNVQIEWQPSQPAWVRPFLKIFVPEDVLRDAVVVKAESCRLTDEDLKHLRHMPLVEKLYLAGNPITDDGLELIQDLTRVERLSLWGTKISDEGLRHLGRMESLTVLDIHDPLCYFRLGSASYSRPTQPPGLPPPTSEFQLTGQSLEHLHGAKNLRAIYFSFPLNDADLANLAKLPNVKLRTLILRDVTDVGLAHLQSWPDLQTLRVEWATVGDDGLRTLGSLPNLRRLWLNGVIIAEDAGESLGELTQLEQLSLRSSSIRDRHMPFLGKLTRLRWLSLRNVQITDDGVAELKRLTQLQTLNLLGTPTTADCLEHLAPLSELQTLYFHTPLDDEAVGWLAGLPKLAALQGSEMYPTYEAYVTDAGLADLGKLNCLYHLDLHDARDGAALEGVDVPNGAGTMTNAGLQQFWSNQTIRHVRIHGQDITAAGFRFSPELSHCSSVDLQSRRTMTDLIDCPLAPGAGSATFGWRTVRVQAGEGIGPRNIEFRSDHADVDLGLLRYLPTITQLKVTPLGPSSPNGDWDHLRHVPNLETFETPGYSATVQLDAVGVRHLGEMKSLRHLVVDLPVGFSAEDLAPLGQLKGLETLQLCCGPLDAEQLRILSQLSGLRKLMISSHPRSVRDEGGLRFLAELKQLQELWLYGLTDVGMSHVGQIKSLQRLSVNGPEITDEGSRHLDNLPNLTHLDARSTGISDERLDEFKKRQPQVFVR